MYNRHPHLIDSSIYPSILLLFFSLRFRFTCVIWCRGFMAAEAINGDVVAGAGDLKATFRQIYGTLKLELLQDEAFDYTDEARQWIERVLSAL